jgi:hypothetical protein
MPINLIATTVPAVSHAVTIGTPLLVGLIAAFMSVAIASLVAVGKKRAWGRVVSVSTLWGWMKREVHTRSTWSPSDSWVTNVTALGGLLGSIVSAEGGGFLSSVAPSLRQHDITVAALIFGGVSVMSPLAYAAFRISPLRSNLDARPDEDKVIGTVGGMMVACLLVLFAAFGGLGLVAVIVGIAQATVAVRVFLEVGIGLIAAILTLYAVRSIYTLGVYVPPVDGEKVAGSLMSARRSASATL